MNVTVGLGPRAYEVEIGPGLLDRAGQKLAPFAPRGRTAVVTDQNVADHHGERLAVALERGGLSVDMVVIPPGEGTKCFEGLASLTDQLLSLGLDRGDLVTAFGGGVVGDLAGFAAAIYKRGIDFVQIPTTLLAQVDSSVGGKTAIDTAHGKNMVGAFHQPRLVLADLDVMATLPPREVHAGYAEIVKYGLLGDLGFLEWLESHAGAVLALDVGALGEAVTRSVAMKARIVAEDEREGGVRALLNLGHTFAHALEAETGYGEVLLHGEAVGAGCALAFRFSAALGLCPPDEAARAVRAIAAGRLPTRMDQIAGAPFSAERLIAHMGQDKKAEGGRLTFILARGVGQAFVAKGVDPEKVRAFLIAEGALP
ncbi:MAG TPA: 3-dehydroquinate synthase [Caulobacteraceae bacterium]|jgi:3-dehydroquinate synthase|nr:3-dehydroquinate synthase [Caulobacteraceae bacterium]